MNYTISKEYDERAVLDYLKKELKMSRAEITWLKKKENGIILNGNRVNVRAVLYEGSILSIDRSDKKEEQNKNLIPKNIPVEIIYEDENIIAVNKPFGMPTHPSHGHFDDTLANSLAYYFSKKDTPFIFRAATRLDRDTSGIVLVAKNRFAAYQLSKQLSSGIAQKEYTAIVTGVIKKPGCIKVNIKRKEKSIIERTVCCSSEGQYAETSYTPIISNGQLTVLKVFPKTGRTHQIRVHLSSIGHPILGDTLYGNNKECDIIERQALHCSKLTIKNINTGKDVILEAGLFDDMKEIYSKIYKENLLHDITKENLQNE